MKKGKIKTNLFVIPACPESFPCLKKDSRLPGKTHPNARR
jgi:hypothetical protein